MAYNIKEPAKESNLVIFAALAANLGVAVAKFIAAGISGSSSMLTEGFHSVVDSGNQVLLLYGKHRAKKPADHDHPFGYERELYFWSFVVAILLFAVGAGVSVYEGYVHLVHPEELTNPTLNYIVLAVAFVLEAASSVIALKEFTRSKGRMGWWQAIRHSKDPSILIVLFENSAALAGLVVAAIGVYLSRALDEPRIDGIASIIIGLILGVVAALLAREAKGLLIGERADNEVIRGVYSVVGGHAGVSGVNHVRTLHTGPASVFVALSVDFDDSVTMGRAETLIEEIEAELKQTLPSLSTIYIRPEKAENATVVAPPERPKT
jgi:cation diffusion facilitator family transporter